MHPTPELLTAYAQGKLAQDSTTEIEAHLENCAECDTTVEQLLNSTKIVETLRRTPAEPPSPMEPECGKMVEAILNVNEVQTQTREANPPPPSATITPQLREYQILEKLGEGGMGAVYRAVHTKLDKVVAVKVLSVHRQDEKRITRFEREMKAIGKLQHPNVVAAHDAGEVDGTHFLVMEFVDGVDVAKILHRRRILEVADACEIARQAAIGLHEAHKRGMVHRDIKPSNLMVTTDGSRQLVAGSNDLSSHRQGIVKVLDMGLALLEGHATDDGDLTSVEHVMGTVNYMSPEQAADAHTVDTRADIYSLGVVLFEMLSGQIPLEKRRRSSVTVRLAAIANEPNPSLRDLRPELPDPLIALVDRMLSKRPEDRPATPLEVAVALEPFARTQQIANLIPSLDSNSSSPTMHVDAVRFEKTQIHQISTLTQQGTMANGLRAIRPSPRWRSPTIVAAATLCLAFAAIAFGVIFLKTPQGTLRVEVADPNVEVRILGTSIVLKNADERDVTVDVGDHVLHVSRDDFSFETDKLVLKKGKTVTVKIDLLPEEVRVVADKRVIGSHKLEAPVREVAIRNPFGVPDPELDPEWVREFEEVVKIEGGDDDPNAASWAEVASDADSIEGEWQARWSYSDKDWQLTHAVVKIKDENIYFLVGDNEYLLEARRVGKDRLVGGYGNVDSASDATPWVGRIINNHRIDGFWDTGKRPPVARWDFRRK